MTRLLKELIKADHISDVKDKMSSVQDIFNLQEMYDIKNKEKKLFDHDIQFEIPLLRLPFF